MKGLFAFALSLSVLSFNAFAADTANTTTGKQTPAPAHKCHVASCKCTHCTCKSCTGGCSEKMHQS